MEEAIRYVMYFYDISREAAINFYMDEIEAYMRLKQRFELECE